MANKKNINNSSGWVSVHRSLAKSSLWNSEKFTRGQAWIDMIILANHTEGYIRVREQKIQLSRGQLGWSMTKLGERWRWSPGKVKRYMQELEKEKMVTIQANNVSSVITLINYNFYQQDISQTNCKEIADALQTIPNNNKTKSTMSSMSSNEKEKILPPTIDDVILFFINEGSNITEAKKFYNYYSMSFS